MIALLVALSPLPSAAKDKDPDQLEPEAKWLGPSKLAPEPTYGVPSHVALGEPVGKGPGSYRARKLINFVRETEPQIKASRYDHRVSIDRESGQFDFDCSGMVTWMLGWTAPKARDSLRIKSRPVAATIHRIIHYTSSVPKEEEANGWRRIRRITDVRPGDVFAWRQPYTWPQGGVSGHTGIVWGAPQPMLSRPGAYLVRILDSTSEPHGSTDTRPPGTNGYGYGDIMFVTDEKGVVVGYGWHGSESDRIVYTEVVFGRLEG